MSKELGDLVVKKCVPEEFLECDMVFSGLDSDVAGDVGEPFPKPMIPQEGKLTRHQKWLS